LPLIDLLFITFFTRFIALDRLLSRGSRLGTPAAIISFSNPDSIEKLNRELKTVSTDRREIMFTTRKLIDSGSLWLLTVCVLSLCLAVPAPCIAASSPDLAMQANHLLLPSNALADDLPDIIIPKLPPPPPPALLAGDLPDIIIPKLPPPPPQRA